MQSGPGAGLVHRLCPDFPTTRPWANLFTALSLSFPFFETGSRSQQ